MNKLAVRFHPAEMMCQQVESDLHRAFSGLSGYKLHRGGLAVSSASITLGLCKAAQVSSSTGDVVRN